MRISVRVKPGAKNSLVTAISSQEYVVEVDAPAKENKANLRLLEIMADYFQVPKTSIRFIAGVKSRDKILQIDY